MNDLGQVVSIIDANGGETKYEYDDPSKQKTKEVDPVGGETALEYDERGNLTKKTYPDGAEITLDYDHLNQLMRVVDAIGGEWRWGFDQNGRLLGRANPLDERTQFQWEGTQLLAVTDPAGQQTALTYDSAQNLATLTTPDGATSAWRYDGLGRPLTVLDPNNNVLGVTRDPLGRVVATTEPDGNQRVLNYDPEGNLIRTQDRQYDVGFEYRGMNRLAARTQAGKRVEFLYDTEGQLVAIKNEHGFAYRFILGATGDVDEEWGFDDLRRRYLRDPAGRALQIARPEGKQTVYAYDKASRLTDVKYSDGTREAYHYRRDGVLLKASNDAANIEFERDPLGRVVKELSGSDWVSSEYDTIGLRKTVRSSKGHFQKITRNAVGDVVGVDAESGKFNSTFERDRLGLELERSLPGGIRARWERDLIGRPIRQDIWQGTRFVNAKQYVWGVNTRLTQVIDAMTGPVDYMHDAIGNLAAARYADGKVDLRMPDAVGNLFRTPERGDRKYGPGGQLLEAHDARGVTTYRYDPEGNLITKVQPDGSEWTYEWSGAGMLTRVTRPNGHVVELGYDALARRTFKKYRGKTTKWIWDSNVPLHEWVERDADAVDEDFARKPLEDDDAVAIAEKQLAAMLSGRPANGPPEASDPSSGAPALKASAEGTAAAPVTWVFEPERFSPLAKLIGGAAYGFVNDHMGCPKALFDEMGREVWAAQIDIYGDLRDLRSPRRSCLFRWPGQYEDAETGLRYNRFRYQNEHGCYISQDPIGLDSGLYNLYQYVRDPLVDYDPLGLDWNYFLSDANGNPYYHGRASDNQSMSDVARRHAANDGTDGARFGKGDTLNRTTGPGTDYDAVRGIEQRGTADGSLLGRGSDKVRGHKIAGISAEKQAGEDGIRRLKAGDAILDGRKPSEMPPLAKLEFGKLCKG